MEQPWIAIATKFNLRFKTEFTAKPLSSEYFFQLGDPGNHSAIGTDICNLGTWRTLMYGVWENQPVIECID